jgi:hypothetical protein
MTKKAKPRKTRNLHALNARQRHAGPMHDKKEQKIKRLEERLLQLEYRVSGLREEFYTHQRYPYD